MPYDSDRACSSTKNDWPENTTQHIQAINHGGIIERTRGFAHAAPSQHFGEPLIRRQVRTLDPKNSIIDLRDLHPLPSQIPYIWEVYIMNVDPILKAVHVPSTNEDIRNIVRDPTRVVPETEALMFAIYYAAIISMEVHDVTMDFGVEKSHLLEKFRYGVEQALVKVDFLNNSALSVIQALTLFLVMAYRFEDRRFPCALMSLLIRLNQSLGLYGGGFHSSAVSLFEMEIYRRLWWTASTLDLSYAERDGTELIIDPRACHPEYPLNIGDEDISPDMKRFSCSRDGVTGMAFIIAQYQICSLARRTRQSAGQETPGPLDANPRIQALKELLYTGYKPLGEGLCIPYADHYEECHCGTDHAIIDRFTQAAMCVAAYQSMRLSAAEQDVNKVRDLLLSPSIEVVECIALFHTEPKYKRFHWALRSSEYLQAIGYLAIEICQGFTAYHAWDIAQETDGESKAQNEPSGWKSGNRERELIESGSDYASAPPTSHVDTSPMTDDLSSNIMATEVRVFDQPQSHDYASAYGDGFLQTSSQTTASADDTTPFLLTRPEFRLDVGSNPEITANTSFSPSF
ncbi:fungal specific transcription factor domain-containing protein [Seiridium cupressi]